MEQRGNSVLISFFGVGGLLSSVASGCPIMMSKEESKAIRVLMSEGLGV